MLRACLKLFPVLMLGLMLHGKAVAAARFHSAPAKPGQTNSHRARHPLNICAETNVTVSPLTDTHLPVLIGPLPRPFDVNALFSQTIEKAIACYEPPVLITNHQLLFPFHVFW